MIHQSLTSWCLFKYQHLSHDSVTSTTIQKLVLSAAKWKWIWLFHYPDGKEPRIASIRRCLIDVESVLSAEPRSLLNINSETNDYDFKSWTLKNVNWSFFFTRVLLIFSINLFWNPRFLGMRDVIYRTKLLQHHYSYLWVWKIVIN